MTEFILTITPFVGTFVGLSEPGGDTEAPESALGGNGAGNGCGRGAERLLEVAGQLVPEPCASAARVVRGVPVWAVKFYMRHTG